MGKIATLCRLIRNNPSFINAAICDNVRRLWLSHLIPDKVFLKWVFKVHLHKPLNFTDPKGFNAKLQWMKIYDRNPDYVMLVDKLRVKEDIQNKIGAEYVIPTLGVWKSADEIDFDSLPNKFVLKCNHDSRSVVVCKDKSKLDINKAKEHLNRCLRKNLYWWGREWPYKDVEPKVFAEQLLEERGEHDLKDYKLMCFGGEVKCSFVCSERFEAGGLKVTFFDRDWKKMPFIRHYPSSNKVIPKPQTYDKMIVLAEKLSQGLRLVRVDFYEVEGQLYLGDLTFFPGSGFEEFIPDCWDEKIGDWIKI